MDLNRVSMLLNRQNKIYKEIEKLNLESLEINDELEKYIVSSESENKRPKRREFLESLGFEVTSKQADGTHLYVISLGDVKHTIIFKQSKFHSVSNYNAWYTFNVGTDKLANFIILEYLTLTDKPVYAVIPKALFTEIAEQATAFSDGRFNLFVLGDEEKAIVRDSNIDLTSTLNNFDILKK